MTEIVHVAVGILRNEQKQVLITYRSPDKHQGGLWEFPGGKVEDGEAVQAALERELREELDLEIGAYMPLLQIEHDYGDKQVLLDVWEVTRFQGQARGMEGQPLRWVEVACLNDYAFPSANLDIVDFLQKGN